jgi:hypothetical protein
MQKFLFYTLCFFFTILFFIPGKIIAQSSNLKQGISGFVYRISGNQMPSPNRPPAKPYGLQTTLFIYEVTNIKDVIRKGSSSFYYSINKKLISTLHSDSTGHFLIKLPVGVYSVFTKVNHLYYANSFDEINNIAPVKVEKGKISEIIIKIDAGAFY